MNDAIRFPDKIEVSRAKSNRSLIKKVYYHEIIKKDHLLMIIYEKGKDMVKVITVIDTSKISKYFYLFLHILESWHLFYLLL